MQPAETVLNVIRERGERGLPLENIYRLLYNRNLYLRAYGRIYSNQGATTKGITAETMDGMSLAKIDRIIEALRYERFRWTPVRRVNIPKPNGTTRALGIPTGPDKLLQEVIRMILEAYYEPQFSDRSHGFRPDRGCHTALSNVVDYWSGVRWFVEGDIKGCFDNIDHEVMLSVLGERLHDNRFLRLLKYLLKAGYVEDWKYGRTLSGKLRSFRASSKTFATVLSTRPKRAGVWHLWGIGSGARPDVAAEHGLSPTELVARIKAALRKREAPEWAEPPEPYVFGDLTVDYAERRVTLAGRPVQLTAIRVRAAL